MVLFELTFNMKMVDIFYLYYYNIYYLRLLSNGQLRIEGCLLELSDGSGLRPGVCERVGA